MLVRINIGGTEIYFGSPQSPQKPVPFYPWLVEVDAIQDSTGEETGSTSFRLLLRAQALLGLNLRRKVLILTDDLEPAFEGVIGRLGYMEAINVTVEA
jgi:hypothetical protein